MLCNTKTSKQFHFTHGRKALIAAMAGIALGFASSAQATITDTGDVNPSPPVAGQGVIVGDSGVGTLTIDGGSSFSTGTTDNTNRLRIGVQATGDGTVLIDGAGTGLETFGIVTGVAGRARFTVSGGAEVTVTDDISVTNTGLNGNSILVTGINTLLDVGDSIFVNGPDAQPGVLTVQDNATLRINNPAGDLRFFIGSNPNETGVVNVTSGATLELIPDGANPFRTFVGVGDDATGILNINSGATVTLGRTDVGTESLTATGIINVDGAGTTLNIITGGPGGNGEGDIRLGSNGGGTATLNVTGGAVVNVADDIFVALGDDSTAAFNAIEGEVHITDGLFVGYNSDGPLTVGPNMLITASRFVVTNTSLNPNITPGHADVTFQLSEDGGGTPISGLIETGDFSFRDGTRNLLLDLDPSAVFEVGDKFVLVDYETLGLNSFGALDQTFNNVGDDELITFDGIEFLINYNDNLGGGDFALTATVTAIPEPTSLALLGLGSLALIRRRRKSAQ